MMGNIHINSLKSDHKVILTKIRALPNKKVNSYIIMMIKLSQLFSTASMSFRYLYIWLHTQTMA